MTDKKSVIRTALREMMLLDDAGIGGYSASKRVKRIVELKRIIHDALAELSGTTNRITKSAATDPILSGQTGGGAWLDAKKLQNRDRSRSAYVDQMRSMSNALDYNRLSVSRTPATGAPMAFSRGVAIPPDRAGNRDVVSMSDGVGGTRKVSVIYAVVEAADLIASHDADGMLVDEYGGVIGIMALNNGRSAAIKSAYDRGKAEGYIADMLADQSHGVSRKAIESMREPVLVRMFSEADIEGIDDPGAASNEKEGATLSTAEQAATDAARLPDNILLRYQGGDIHSSQNRDFVMGFVQAMGGQSAVGEMLGSGGALSQIGAKRIEAALVAKAYGDNALLAELVEDTDSELLSIGTALKDAAGSWSGMVNRAKEGLAEPSLDITKNLIDALGIIRRARIKGTPVTTQLNQQDVFSGKVDPVTEAIVTMMYRPGFSRIRSAAQIEEGLKAYVHKVEGTPPGVDMFGKKPDPTEIMTQVADKLSEDEILRKNQASLFDSAMTPSSSRDDARRKTAQMLDYMAMIGEGCSA